MNAERLLAHYQRIAEVPDAVERLRQFIRELAVRGALVSEHPSDGPASALLDEVAAEVDRLRNSGAHRDPRSSVVIKRDDLPFRPPARWCWAKLTEIASASYGFAFPSERFNAEKRGMPLIRIRDISSTDTEAYFDGPYDASYIVKAGDYLVGMDGDFNLHRWRGLDGLLNQRVLRLNGWRCGVDPEFVLLPLQFILDHLHDETSQTTVKHLSAKQVNSIEIPLPPVAEQRRIVAKVNELMALCDRLEVARAERETARDRLAVSCLARLNSPDPATFREDSRFVLDALPALSARVNQVKQIRQTILNLAVRGKLVAQDPGDEPAAELLKRLRSDEAIGVRGGKRKQVAEPVPSERAAGLFVLPSSWRWASFSDVARIESNLVEPNGYKAHPHVAPDNIESGTGRLLAYTTVANSGVFSAKHRFTAGCLLYSKIRPALAKVVAVDFEGLCSADMYPIRPLIDRSFLQQYMLAEVFVRQAVSEDNRVAMPKINQEALNKTLVAVPPLPEQKRMAARVTELMALCDRLEASLVEADASRGRLLEALLSEALGERADSQERAEPPAKMRKSDAKRSEASAV